MKRFSAQYIITNSSHLLKRGIISTEDDGTVISIDDTAGALKEEHSVEFHNGIIIPGFVNCHCHLELSHMKGSVPQGKGLGDFVELIRSTRNTKEQQIIKSAYMADNEMYDEGISLCADICNTSETFQLKKESRISYINLLEVFGIDPERASVRMEELLRLSARASEMDLQYWLVPHSVYSMSLGLLKFLREKSLQNKVTSIHFMETAGEKEFIENHSGPLLISYNRSGLIPARLETVRNHSEAILSEVSPSGNLILVHNTFVDRKTVRAVQKRKNLFWCLCPNSNLYIESTIPPVNLLIEEECKLVIGTDSLASNTRLSILEELKTLQKSYPSLSIEDLVSWATINGAMALGKDDKYGTIEPGKSPGLLLLQNVDLVNMKLLPDSFVTRLI